MAFLHCESCNWMQDDFWDDSYNPFRQDIVDNWKELLKKDEISVDRYALDELHVPYETRDGKCYADTRYFLAGLLERKAKIIRGMKIKTYNEWLKVCSDFTCPKCGSKNLDID